MAFFMRFRIVLGQWAVLKISDWVVKYATFEGISLCFHGQKKWLYVSYGHVVRDFEIEAKIWQNF